MGKLMELLRWKKIVLIQDANGNPLKDAKGNPVKVWMRILGDEDQQTAYKLARIRSAEKRAALRNPETIDYKDEVLPIQEASREICIELIKAARSSNFTSEALANIERPELPKLEEFSVDPDAPTLEEQEKLDKATEAVEEEYQKALRDYIDTKTLQLETDLGNMSDEEIKKEAMYETSNALALNSFLMEVQDEKTWRSVYTDEGCKVRAFEGIQEFRELPSNTKNQLIDEYNNLEISPDEIKN